jgi:hypothetical protein
MCMPVSSSTSLTAQLAMLSPADRDRHGGCQHRFQQQAGGMQRYDMEGGSLMYPFRTSLVCQPLVLSEHGLSTSSI